MVARFVRDEEVAGSNPVTPTGWCPWTPRWPGPARCRSGPLLSAGGPRRTTSRLQYLLPPGDTCEASARVPARKSQPEPARHTAETHAPIFRDGALLDLARGTQMSLRRSPAHRRTFGSWSSCPTTRVVPKTAPKMGSSRSHDQLLAKETLSEPPGPPPIMAAR